MPKSGRKMHHRLHFFELALVLVFVLALVPALVLALVQMEGGGEQRWQ